MMQSKYVTGQMEMRRRKSAMAMLGCSMGMCAALAGCGGTAALNRSAGGGVTVPAGSATPDSSSNGTLSFDARTQVVAQSGGTAYFMVQRTGGTSGAVGVSYATGSGTAVPGTDYTAESGTLSWSSGDSSVKTIAVPIVRRTPAAKVTFHIDLTSPTGGATVGSVPEAVVSLEDSFTAPSTLSNFNFSPWKLTLPIDEYRGTGNTYGAVTIQPADLTNGFADDFFYASGTKVVFYDPSNGATTTPGSGSDHTRSELRELYTGSGHDSNDDWTSSIGGTLSGTCTVDQTSPDTDEATFAQIHGQSYVFALLEYRPGSSDVALVLYNSNSSSGTSTAYPVKTGINLGSTLTYTLSYSGTTVTAKVNGTTLTKTVDSSWTGTPVYFKAGAYSAAPNSGNGASDATQVTYSALTISHP